MTILIISNKEMKHTTKIVKSLQESGLEIKDVSKTIKKSQKIKKLDFFTRYQVHQLLFNLKTCQQVKGLLKLPKEQLYQARVLILPHPLTDFETQKYCHNGPKFKRVYSKNNLPKINNGPHIINLDEYKSIGTHWINLYVSSNKIIHFVSFRAEHIPNEIKKFFRN